MNPRLVKLKVKAMKVGNSVRVAIPSEICEVCGIKIGDTLLIDHDEKQDLVTLDEEK